MQSIAEFHNDLEDKRFISPDDPLAEEIIKFAVQLPDQEVETSEDKLNCFDNQLTNKHEKKMCSVDEVLKEGFTQLVVATNAMLNELAAMSKSNSEAVPAAGQSIADEMEAHENEIEAPGPFTSWLNSEENKPNSHSL